MLPLEDMLNMSHDLVFYLTHCDFLFLSSQLCEKRNLFVESKFLTFLDELDKLE